MAFWIAAAVFSALVALALAAAFFRARAEGVPAAAYDLKVYRDQLKELDRDVARGVVSEEEAGRARTEIARRILEADRALQTARQNAPRRGGIDKAVLGLGLGATIAGAFAVYLQVGAPGYPDLSLATRIEIVEDARATRPDQSTAEQQVPFREGMPPDPEHEELVRQLRTVMEQRPDDIQGLALLAVNEAALGNFRAARLAQGRLIGLLGEDASGFHHIDHAEMMILAAGGYVSPEAEQALVQGLDLEPRNGTARYYAGLMFAQQGRPDLAFPIWRNLLADSTADAPWVEPIRLQIEEIAFLAGSPISVDDLPQPPPPARAGPSAEDIAAAEALPAEDRAAMIEGMVSGLAARLAEEGGPPEDWARLITAYTVLGRLDLAQSIYTEALVVFDDLPEAIAMIEDAGAALTEPAE